MASYFQKSVSTGSTSSTGSHTRPLPLKQRTSSVDTRRDYSSSTWTSLLVLLKSREYFVTVDHFSLWRRHLAWAGKSGSDLRGYMTQRYSSNMVFMSLLLSTQLAVLFNSATVTTNVRLALKQGSHYDLSFYAGFMIIVSSLLTILSLISVFTAWSMVNAVSEENAHCVFRSSIGQYAAELPGRLIVCSIYSFLISFILFFFLLFPVGFWSFSLVLIAAAGFVHIVSVFSAFGRVIMHSGAMGKSRIFTPEYEDSLVPHTLHRNLLMKAQANLANNISISRQYRRKQTPINRHLPGIDEMYDHLSGVNLHRRNDDDEDVVPYRPRADSAVRFADEDIEIGVNKTGTTTTPSSSHFRSLTPLSEASSTSSLQPFTTDEGDKMSSPRLPSPSAAAAAALVRSSSIGKKNSSARSSPPPRPFSSSSRRRSPPLPSMNPFSSNDTLPSVSGASTRSLEQWLQQASSPTMSENDANNVGNESNKGDSDKVRNGGNYLPQQLLKHQHERPTKPTISGSSIGSYSSATSEQDVEGGLTGTTILTINTIENNNPYPPSRRSGGLSEEERLFNLDYGDDIMDPDDVINVEEKSRSRKHKQQQHSNRSRRSPNRNYDDAKYHDDGGDDEAETSNEKTSLLPRKEKRVSSYDGGRKKSPAPQNTTSYTSIPSSANSSNIDTREGQQRPPCEGG